MVVLPNTGKHGGYRNAPNVVVSSATRPRSAALWTCQDVNHWLSRHCGEVGIQYTQLFRQNNLNGRTLLRMNATALERLGITNIQHREDIWREIMKLKLKSDILELRYLEECLKTS